MTCTYLHLQSARRELDRQRQMEWERQRKEQLMAEKSREYEQLMALKSQTSNLTCELESLVRFLTGSHHGNFPVCYF